MTRKTIYHQHLLARIRAHTQLAPAPSADDGRSNGIIAALRAQLTAKHKEIASLKTMLRQRDTTIAMLYGKLEQHTPARSDSRLARPYGAPDAVHFG